MPRLARWDDSFEFEDIPELIEMFRFGGDGEWTEKDDYQETDDCREVTLSEDQLDELVLGLKTRAERARKSPVTTTSNN